jgi:hypothetical protein
LHRLRHRLGGPLHRLPRRSAPRAGGNLAQSPDRSLERQSLGLEEARCHASPVAHQGSKDNGTVDAGAPALLGRKRRVFEYLRQCG